MRRIEKALHKSHSRYTTTDAPSRRFRVFRYRTRTSWSRARRVVAKAEHLAKGLNPRFVGTSLGQAVAGPQRIYEQLYCARGDIENRIKECQLDLFADRTSTATLRANQLRLYFASFAYVLMHGLRRLGLAGTRWARAQCGTLRVKLLKVAARVRITARKVWLSFSSVYPYRDAFTAAAEVLLPIWSTKRETARCVRQRIGAVMKWAVAQDYREDNPAGDAISAALPKNSVRRRHQRALPHVQVAEALARVRVSKAHRATALAFEFLVLTACRSGEVRGARWDEVDDAAATWTVPPDRMKAKLEHRVPLSARAAAVLDEARKIADERGLAFPSPTGRVLSDSTLSKLRRELGIGAVPHGFRSSFRDWAAERTDVPREVCELALAHVNSDRVEAAYRRSAGFQSGIRISPGQRSERGGNS